LRNGAALAPRKVMTKRLPLDSAVDLEIPTARRHDLVGNSDQNGLHSTLKFLACPRLRFPLRIAATRADIGIKALAAAHAGSRGRLFEHIMRHT
jgi:hypothetical protein